MTGRTPGGRHRVVVGLHRARRAPRWIVVRVAGPAAVAVAAALAILLASSAPAAPSPEAARIPVPVPVPVSLGDGTEHREPEPTGVRVPAIDVASDLVRLDVDEDDTLVPPSGFGRAGWFTGGPRPGETGPAVLAGHVDSFRGPAVFFRLADLERGDEVLVDRTDGTTARFTVTAVDRHPKDEFPTEQVYGPTTRPELRLITCGGEFDSDARSYRDNVVVSAVLAD